VILFGGDASWCPLQHIQNSAWVLTRGDQDLVRIGRCSLFWILPAHALVNLSMFQAIPCLFEGIYHTTMCSHMLSTFSLEWFPKIHPDAPRNACGVQNAAGLVYRIITPWSPTQVTINHHHLMFIMLHVSADSIVQAFLDSCLQSSGTFKSFSRYLLKLQIESAQP
jgi:hypothetical protein